MFNKMVAPALFKKFCFSCWSELCEIYGIPPRYLKTNTTDKAMLNRAEKMMRDMGAAAWMIIDTTEEFNFAQGVNTNGDVYNNLLRFCNSELSLLISGAIIGQDTEHGNRSKEQVAVDMLDRLIQSDRRMIKYYMNATVIPAFIRIGWLPPITGKFRFAAVEDADSLWLINKELLPHKEVDSKWITEKFGIPVADKQPPALQQYLNADNLPFKLDFDPFA
jgi:phage gp29-like protein